MKNQLLFTKPSCRLIKMAIYLMMLNFLFSCGKQKENLPTQNSISRAASNSEDYFEHKVDPELAQHFTVSYHGNYKIVKTDATFYNNEKESDGEKLEDVLVLVQKGTTPPILEGILKGASIIDIPVETVAVNVQHSESFLRELGLENHINTIGGLYSYNNEMRNKAIEGELGQVGYSWHSPPNIEVLIERKPDVFLMTMASMEHNESLEKCRQLDIPTAAVFDWAEKDYLARAEWIKFYALFFNAEEKANTVFRGIKDRITSLKALTVGLSEPESAIWGYYLNKQRWLMQINSFSGQYMRDAGLDNILLANTKPNADGTQVLSTEELLTKGKNAEHWIIGDIHASALPQEEIMSSFEAWRSGQLYHNMERVNPKTNSSDWYATAIVRPDTVVADLIKLAHPELLPGYLPTFLGYYDKETQKASVNELE